MCTKIGTDSAARLTAFPEKSFSKLLTNFQAMSPDIICSLLMFVNFSIQKDNNINKQIVGKYYFHIT